MLCGKMLGVAARAMGHPSVTVPKALSAPLFLDSEPVPNHLLYMHTQHMCFLEVKLWEGP